MPRARAGAEPALRDARARARAPNPASVRSAFVETNTAPDALSIPQAWKIRRAVPRGALVLAVQARREGATQHRQGRKGQNLVHQRGVSPRRGDWCVPPLPVRVGFFRMQETRIYPASGKRGGARVPPPNGRAPRRSSDATRASLPPRTDERVPRAIRVFPRPLRRAELTVLPRPNDSPEPTARPRFARRRPRASIRKKKKKKNSRLRFWLDGRVREPRRPV